MPLEARPPRPGRRLILVRIRGLDGVELLLSTGETLATVHDWADRLVSPTGDTQPTLAYGRQLLEDLDMPLWELALVHGWGTTVTLDLV